MERREREERFRRQQKERLLRERKKRNVRRIQIAFRLGVTAVLLAFCFRLGGQLWGEWLTKPGNVRAGDAKDTRRIGAEENVTGENVNREATYAAAGGITGNERILEDALLETEMRELAGADKELAQIFAARGEYPEELLRSLINNPELKPFVSGYLDADGMVTGGLSEEEMGQDFPLLLQWDARWGYSPYGDSCIGIAGCGPTCLSMVIVALTGNEDATPDKLADYSMENGHYVSGTGTAWTLMKDAARHYGLSVRELGLEEEEMKRQLDWGYPIICAMRAGDFTTVGHFIMIYGYDEDGFIVNDPNSRERSAKRWPYDVLEYQIKNLWAFSC